jgi:hypothetical protein
MPEDRGQLLPERFDLLRRESKASERRDVFDIGA